MNAASDSGETRAMTTNMTNDSEQNYESGTSGPRMALRESVWRPSETNLRQVMLLCLRGLRSRSVDWQSIAQRELLK